MCFKDYHPSKGKTGINSESLLGLEKCISYMEIMSGDQRQPEFSSGNNFLNQLDMNYITGSCNCSVKKYFETCRRRPSTTKVYKCPMCGRKFWTKPEVKEHMKTEHDFHVNF